MNPSHGWVKDRSIRSLERSRTRRAAAEEATREARRRRIRRLPAPGVAIVLALSLAGLGGLGVAGAHVRQSRAAASIRAQGMLNVGSSGPAVAALQRALGIDPTGYFGPQTKSAVQAFQQRRGLAVDGIAGPQTLGNLGISSSAGAPARSGSGTPKGSGQTGGTGTTGGARGRSGAGTAPGGLLQKIAQCESGGNPGAIGGGGKYRGKYQFTVGTWRAAGGKGDPAAASEAEQDRIAAQVLAQSGSGAWANCAR